MSPTKLEILEVGGAPGEMGFTQGESTVEMWLSALDDVKGVRVAEALQRDIEEIFPRQIERTLGIAKGAGVGVETVLLGAFFEVIEGQADYYLGGCSAAAFRDSALLFDGPIIAHNIDSTETLGHAFLLRKSKPEGCFSSIEATLGFSAGSRCGLNEKGLAIAFNLAYSIVPPEKFIPFSMIVQEILERCSSVEQAIELLENTPRANGALIMLADSAGDMAAVELSPEPAGIAVRRPENDRIAHTNHYHTPQLAAVDIPAEACYSDKMPKPLRGLRVRQSSESRCMRFTQLMGEIEKFDESGIEKIFRDHGENNLPDDNTICRHGAFYSTVASVLMFPLRRSVRASLGIPCQNAYLALEFRT